MYYILLSDECIIFYKQVHVLYFIIRCMYYILLSDERIIERIIFYYQMNVLYFIIRCMCYILLSDVCVIFYYQMYVLYFIIRCMYYILFLLQVYITRREHVCLFTLPIYLIIFLRIYVFNGG